MMLAPSTLDLVDQARRRARLAGLLGRLLLEEPGPALAELVADVPALRPLAEADPELAVEYERLFLRAVPLYESLFLGEDGQRGGAIASAVADFYRTHDFDEADQWRVAGPDALGLELRCYATLCAAEARGWDGDRPDTATKAVEAERTMLVAHFGQWAELAMAAVERSAGATPFSALAGAVAAFVAGEAERLRPAPDHPGMPAVEVEPPPRHLGPARLARWFLAPARCGGFLGADDVGAVAVGLGIPWRPSDPRSRLRQVVEAATDGGDVAELLSRLRPVADGWRAEHAERETLRDGDRRTWRAWRLRAEQTLSIIEGVPTRTCDPASAPDTTRGTVCVTVSAPEHRDAVLLAMRVLERLRVLEARIAVVFGVPDQLAADVHAVSVSGAEQVLLVGDSVTAIAFPDGGDVDDRGARHLPDADIVVDIVARGGPMRVTVSGGATETTRTVEALLTSLDS